MSSKNRIIYNVQSIAVGPSDPSNSSLIRDAHVLSHLLRVQSFGYSLNESREDVYELGTKCYAERPIVSIAPISIDLSYLSYNVANEIKLGLQPNYTTSGTPHYSNNFNHCLVSGIMDETRKNDKRNLYLVINDTGSDLLVNTTKTYDNNSENYFIDPNSPNYKLACFNNCYLNSYSLNVEVGNFISCNVGMVASNFAFYTSGSGVLMPYVDERTGELKDSEIHLIIPKYTAENQPSALRPGDITLSIISTGQGATASNIKDLGWDIDDLKIQGFNVSIPFNRKQVEYIGYRMPIDQSLLFPIFVDFGITAMAADNATGSLINLFTRDFDYDLMVKVKNPMNPFSGGQATALQLDLKGARLEDLAYQDSIGQNAVVSYLFRGEINPDNLTRGFFFSGIVNYPELFTGHITADDGTKLEGDDGSFILQDDIEILPNVF